MPQRLRRACAGATDEEQIVATQREVDGTRVPSIQSQRRGPRVVDVRAAGIAVQPWLPFFRKRSSPSRATTSLLGGDAGGGGRRI
jgi:hypothetical protein